MMDRHTQIAQEQRGQRIAQLISAPLPEGYSIARVRRRNVLQLEWWVCYQGTRVGGFALDGDSEIWYRLETNYRLYCQHRSQVAAVRPIGRDAIKQSAGNLVRARFAS